MKLLAYLLAITSLVAIDNDSHLGVSLPGVSGAPEARVKIARQLGASWYRPAPVQLLGDAKCDDCAAAQTAGLNISLVVLNSTDGKSSSPVTDVADFQKRLRAVLERDKPSMLVVENEPEDAKSFSGTPEQYEAELKAACDVAHELKLQCANGGLNSVDIAALTMDQRMGSDPIDAADMALDTEMIRVHTREKLNVNIFAKRVGHVGEDDETQQASVAATKQYLEKHKAEIERTRKFIEIINGAGVNRLNFHWYELQPDNVPRVLDSLHQLSKLDLMCDEMGQKEERAFEVSEKLRQALTNYVWPTIWAGTDGRDGAVGLVDKKGKLRANAGGFQQEARKE
jgi:hypothetical protein